jgi:hypothetical protein
MSHRPYKRNPRTKTLEIKLGFGEEVTHGDDALSLRVLLHVLGPELSPAGKFYRKYQTTRRVDLEAG